MAKILKFDSDAREKLLKGINTLTEAVAATLGPKGRNVAIDKKWGSPNVVHDGVTVAKEIELEDPFENMGAQILKEAASKTNDIAGDGTTTATVLAQAIASEALKSVQAGSNPMVLRKGIDQAVTAVVAELRKMSKKLTTAEEITQIATISAQNDEIGRLISEAIAKVGKDGVITVEEGKAMETILDYKEGMEFDKGFASPYFMTDSERMEANLEDPYILLTDKKISNMQELMPFLEKLIPVSKTLVIISEEVEGEALTALILNKMRGAINVLAVNAPGFGDRRKAMIEDIAVLTGGTVISEETGRKLDSIEIEDLGRAGRVISSKESTVIVAGKGSKKAIDQRIAQIRRELAATDSEFDKEKLQERLAKLTGGVAIMNIGAATETELKEKKERAIDALSATRAALEEGIVPGGEVAILKATRLALDGMTLAGEEQLGVNIVKKAAEAPLRRLVENAGVDAGWVVREITNKFEASKRKDINTGFNVMTESFEDMVKLGIIDPVKVTRSALQNAASVAIMVMTTNVLITEAPEKEKPQMPGGGMPGMGDY